MPAGIDYGMGRTNINRETGIRYGVISCNSVMGEALADFEGDYGEASCPKCGNAATEFGAFEGDATEFDTGHGCADYVCESCEYVFDSQDAFGDEPLGFTYEQDGYSCTMGTDGFGVFVLEAPFYTLARFCSPCAPGAGDLDSPDDDGVKTYCLGADWFDDGKAPYPVYSVATGELIATD